jgi:N-acetylneuraminic acid mutarotase
LTRLFKSLTRKLKYSNTSSIELGVKNLKKALIMLAVTLVFLTISCVFSVSGVKAEVTGNSWEELAPMPTAREKLGVGVVDGKIYAIGGLSETLNVNEMYDPQTNTWTTKQPIPTPRAGFGIAVCDNKIYCIGGWTLGSKMTTANEVYDPAADSWTTLNPAPTGDTYTATVVNEKIYIISENQMYEFNPASNSWATKTPMPTPAIGFSSASINNKIYVFGGSNNDAVPFSDMAIDKVQIYDCNTDSWSYGASLPISLVWSSASVTSGVYAPQRIYVIGGKEAVSYNYTWIYNPENNSWSKGADLPTPRGSLGVSVVDDILYAIGGSGKINGDNPVPVNERYVPVGYSRVDSGSDSAFGSLSPVLVIAGVAVAATVIVAAGVTVYHFKHAPAKAAKPS